MSTATRPRGEAGTAADVSVSERSWALGPSRQRGLSLRGLMAMAREAGSGVVCITATRGERGSAEPDQWPSARLATVRDRELEASMATLGVAERSWLDFQDGLCARSHVFTDAVRADNIVTFGPDGMTGHSDHRAVSRWTTLAWYRSRRQARLLYATTAPDFAREYADIHDAYGRFGPGLPRRLRPSRLHFDSASTPAR